TSRLHLFTDGVVDQFDGEQRMKFSLKRLVHLITTHADTPLEEAERGIVEALNAWRQEGDQIDDMLMVAVEPVAAWHHKLVDAEAVAA
ncbi:MAG TPA: SpoIIE family protein phosphatase, partial [Flavobacteriales bacterium]|nr:SpoIIE family protein phosphatase [Flavobacteriales bacterium]